MSTTNTRLGRRSATDRLPFRGRVWFALDRFSEAGLFSYLAGVGGLAAFHAFGIAPVWLGFVAGALPTSLLAALFVMDHD